jgi:hypothetical protein
VQAQGEGKGGEAVRRVFEWLDNLDPMTAVLILAGALLLLYVLEWRRRS